MTPEQTTWECPFCFGEGSHSEHCDLRHRSTPPASPTVHLNGTGYDALYAYTSDAAAAVEVAIHTLCISAPNGRDYYVQSPDAIKIAQDEHWDRIARLRQIKAELDYIAMRVSEQEPKR